jgi:hypothetical protein
MKQMRDLPEQAKYDLALRIYDLMQYRTHRFARRIPRTGPRRLSRDSAARLRRDRSRHLEPRQGDADQG